MTHIRWQILLIVIGVALVGILLTYLAFNYTTVLRPGHGGTYVEGVVGYPQYLNPLMSGYNDADRDICSLVFSGLTRLNERGEIVPDLARSWDVSLDGLSYTFYLRRDARWHDGAPVTADDVIFTIGLLKDPAFPGPPDLGANVWQVTTVEKINATTVRFTLAEAYAPFLDYTTMGILPSHLLQGISAINLPTLEFNLHPIGSGPFRVAEVNIEEGVVTSVMLETFPAYYGTNPYLDRVQFRFYPSYQTALDAYARGEITGIARIPPNEIARANTFSSLNLFSAPIAEYGMVLLNLRRSTLPFFQEQEVRQALLYALDRQAIIDQALQGQGVIAHSPLIPGTWAYDDNIPRYTYDPEKANDLLNSAGWRLPRGARVRRRNDQQMAFTLLTSSEQERIAAAHIIADQWAALGITVTVQVSSPTELQQALSTRNFDAALIHVALPGDPDPYPFWHETQIDAGQNYGGFTNRRISEVIEQARVLVLNTERRRELYAEFQQLFSQELPALPLYIPVYTYGVDERIHDVQIGPLMYPSDRFRTIAAWWIVPRRVFERSTSP